MNDMIKAEREKILARKSVRILFMAGIFVIIAYFFLFEFHYSSVFYNYETGKMDSVSGFEAIKQRKETAAVFEGELSQDKVLLMQEKLAEAEKATETGDENSAFSARHVYRDQAAILEYLTNPDGSMKALEEAYPNHVSVTLGYCDGWDKILSGMGNVLAILVCLIVVVAISPVFAEEYSWHTDSIIYAARYGRTKLVTAKVIAALETVLGIYVILLLLHVMLYAATYGLAGGNVSIQSSLHYASSTYNLTFLQAFGISAVLHIWGIIALTVITLFLSAKMNSPVSALIISCFVCFAPVFFDFSDSAPLLQKLQEICPIFMLHVNGIFMVMKTYMGVRQPVFMFGFNLVLVFGFYLFTRRVAAKHQVAG